MRQYELVVVFSPILSDEDKTSARDRIKQLITNGDGEITQEEDWGMRRLAYPIRKGSQTFLEGSYFLTRFSTDTVAPRELEPQLNLGENILRYLLVNADSVNITAPTTADFTPREPGPRRFDSRRGPGGPFRGPPPPPGGPPGAPRAAVPSETPTAAPSAEPAAGESPTGPPEASAAQSATDESPAAPSEASAATPDAQAPVEASAATPDTQAPVEASAATPDTQAPVEASAATPDTQAPVEASAATPDTQAPVEAPAATETAVTASDESSPNENAEE